MQLQCMLSLKACPVSILLLHNITVPSEPCIQLAGENTIVQQMFLPERRCNKHQYVQEVAALVKHNSRHEEKQQQTLPSGYTVVAGERTWRLCISCSSWACSC